MLEFNCLGCETSERVISSLLKPHDIGDPEIMRLKLL